MKKKKTKALLQIWEALEVALEMALDLELRPLKEGTVSLEQGLICTSGCCCICSAAEACMVL